jgi:prepilin-type processing-associated H-X9-DG protein
MGQKSYMELASTGHVPRPADHSYFSCPDAVDNGQPNFWSYGMNMWLSIWDNRDPDKINAVGEQSSMVLLADGPANYASVSPSALPYCPVARHGGKVNMVFLDAHVASLDAGYVGCGTGPVDHADLRWQVPGSTWSPDKSK